MFEFLSILGAVWVVCGIFNYGATLAYFQRRWPTIARISFYEDVRAAIMLAVLGPLGTLIVVGGIQTNIFKYGFMFRIRKR